MIVLVDIPLLCILPYCQPRGSPNNGTRIIIGTSRPDNGNCAWIILYKHVHMFFLCSIILSGPFQCVLRATYVSYTARKRNMIGFDWDPYYKEEYNTL